MCAETHVYITTDTVTQTATHTLTHKLGSQSERDVPFYFSDLEEAETLGKCSLR